MDRMPRSFARPGSAAPLDGLVVKKPWALPLLRLMGLLRLIGREHRPTERLPTRSSLTGRGRHGRGHTSAIALPRRHCGIGEGPRPVCRCPDRRGRVPRPCMEDILSPCESSPRAGKVRPSLYVGQRQLRPALGGRVRVTLAARCAWDRSRPPDRARRDRPLTLMPIVRVPSTTLTPLSASTAALR